jgi:hypothetical protein
MTVLQLALLNLAIVALIVVVVLFFGGRRGE